jgi:hypothetical protein
VPGASHPSQAPSAEGLRPLARHTPRPSRSVGGAPAPGLPFSPVARRAPVDRCVRDGTLGAAPPGGPRAATRPER